jgi:hypothetical protein
MYIPGLRGGIYIQNPLKMSRVIYYGYEPKCNSKWLLKKKSKLEDKFYRRRILRNKLIVYPLTILAGFIGLSSSIYGVYLLNKNFHLSGNSGAMLGINVALITIACGFYAYSKLEDKFPFDNWSISINNRKRK